jgi:hypothetical protein
MALVTWLGLSGMDPAALASQLAEPVVPGVTPDQARFLLEVASGFHAARAVRDGVLDTPGCRQYLEESFIDDYWHYARKGLRKEKGWLRGTWSAWRSQQQFEDWVRVHW